ncbi:hypothetical protein M9H77_16972 [Catharanthus roseus]|uniref:Uncharacterized protein n=1 Tax=Catharanthus roseus TaxID=4058 RepID=A0ACC0B3A8_CATRO|nr:hypothetical protein M9H77_16972 [Catharanthus roseus]
MDSKVAAVLNPPVYEDFEASTDLVEEKDCDTILLTLPGFKKEHLKVQLTSAKMLRISGSRPIGDNKWKRFMKEFPVSPNHDSNKINAKFESGILYIRLPKLSPPLDHHQNIKEEEEKEEEEEEEEKQLHSTKSPTQKTEQTSQKPNAAADQNVKEEPKTANEKGEKSKEEKLSHLDDDSKEKKSIASDHKQEEDGAKKSGEERDSEKKRMTKRDKLQEEEEEQEEEDSAKTAEEEGKESSETIEGSGKSKVHNYKETAADIAKSQLKKYRRTFNLALVIIFALTVGLYLSNFIRTIKRDEN